MLFSELMLRSRYRFQDIRKRTGAKITLASEDGIRWTSAEIARLCSDGLQEMMRTLVSLKLTNYINTGVFNRETPVIINAGTGIVGGLGTGWSKILSMQLLSDASALYEPMEAEEFHAKRYLTSDLPDSNPGIEGRYYMINWDASNNIPQVLTLPLPASLLSAVATLKFSLTTLYNISSAIALPFIDIDDLMLDFIERQGKSEDHDENRVVILSKLINQKILEMVRINEMEK